MGRGWKAFVSPHDSCEDIAVLFPSSVGLCVRHVCVRHVVRQVFGLSACYLEMHYWIALTLHVNHLHQICYSIPTIVQIIIFYLLFTHFLGTLNFFLLFSV